MKTKRTSYTKYRRRASLGIPANLSGWVWILIERALKNAFDAGVRHGRKK